MMRFVVLIALGMPYLQGAVRVLGIPLELPDYFFLKPAPEDLPMPPVIEVRT